MDSSIAKSYAQAFYQTSSSSEVTSILNGLRALNNAITENESLKSCLFSPTLDTAEKQNVIKAISKSLPESVKSFALFLLERNRLTHLNEIVKEFETVSDDENGVVRGQAISVSPLSSAEREVLEKNISEHLNKKVLLEYKESPSILSGIVARVGSFEFNGSAENSLRNLTEELKRRTN